MRARTRRRSLLGPAPHRCKTGARSHTSGDASPCVLRHGRAHPPAAGACVPGRHRLSGTLASVRCCCSACSDSLERRRCVPRQVRHLARPGHGHALLRLSFDRASVLRRFLPLRVSRHALQCAAADLRIDGPDEADRWVLGRWRDRTDGRMRGRQVPQRALCRRLYTICTGVIVPVPSRPALRCSPCFARQLGWSAGPTAHVALAARRPAHCAWCAHRTLQTSLQPATPHNEALLRRPDFAYKRRGLPCAASHASACCSRPRPTCTSDMQRTAVQLCSMRAQTTTIQRSARNRLPPSARPSLLRMGAVHSAAATGSHPHIRMLDGSRRSGRGWRAWRVLYPMGSVRASR